METNPYSIYCLKEKVRKKKRLKFTCVSFPLTMLNDSSVPYKFLRLFSFKICRWEWENCKCLMLTPAAKRSRGSDVTDRSKSYTESDCIGDDINWSIWRRENAVVPGHSRNNPETENEICVKLLHHVKHASVVNIN